MATVLSQAAAEREAANAGGRVDAERRCQPIRLCLVVDVAQQRAALDPGAHCVRGDLYRAHHAQVDHQSVIDQGAARDVVAAAANGQFQAMVARKVDRGQHISRAGAAHDRGRALVDHRIPYLAGFVVVRLAGQEHGAPETALELFDLHHRYGIHDNTSLTRRRLFMIGWRGRYASGIVTTGLQRQWTC